jgi:hypothetical protein
MFRRPGVPSSDPGLGGEVNQEHHHAPLQGALRNHSKREATWEKESILRENPLSSSKRR